MVDSSVEAERPVSGAMDEEGSSIGYPQFSPPGVASSLVAHSLPQPLLSLPVTPPGKRSVPTHDKHSQNSAVSLVEQVPEQGVDTLALRLQHMEALCRDLQREKNVMEDQFGQQRKKFMNLMMQKDEELNGAKRSVEHFSSESQLLRRELQAKEEEVQGVLRKAKAMDSANREAFDADRIKYEEELASLRKNIDVEQRREQAVLVTPEQQRSPSPGDPSLGRDLAKAVQESQVLKAVVVPLEKEIERLQMELSETKERQCRDERPGTPPLIDLETTLPPNCVSPSDSQLQHQLGLERSARQDLEMHTRALERQKTDLQEEVAVLHGHLEDMRRRLREQDKSYQQLQKTWDMANQHFIVAQDKLRQKMYFMEQKQQLLHQTDPPSDSSIPQHEERSSAATTQRLRSRSCESVRGSTDSPPLQTAALENELKRVRQALEQRTVTCESYEAQLQRVQEQMLEELDEKDQELSRLREECSKAKAGVARERKAKEELRRKMEDACKQFKAQVEVFQTGMQSEQARLKTVRDQYTQSKHEAQRDLARFSDERVSLFAQISSAQEEYDCLKVVQAEEAQRYSQHLQEVKQERALAEDGVLALQLRLSEIENENKSSEESLSEQLTLLREQLQLEEGEREKHVLSLKQQLEASRNQIAALELVKAELGQEQHMKEQAMAARTEVEEKSRVFIAEQHRKLEMEVAARQAAERMVCELQRQVNSLRLQLNTSQENQKDFVELSQSLQMKLAQIEEEQTKTLSSPP